MRAWLLGVLILAGLSLGATRPDAVAAEASSEVPSVRGMTISTRTSGHEWGTADFPAELDRLQALGVNWIAIHPYAGVRADGELRWRSWEGDAGPDYLAKAIDAAHARGMQILVKPHIAYWGSPFAWRGDIRFDDPKHTARFWADLSRWTVALARASRRADGFSVGCELRHFEADEARWRALIAEVRVALAGQAVGDDAAGPAAGGAPGDHGARKVESGRSPSAGGVFTGQDAPDGLAATSVAGQGSAPRTPQLTYAANWDSVLDVPFWDALDSIGVQAYYPLEVETAPGELPTEAQLRAAWTPHLVDLMQLSMRTGKPVVFLELGYDRNVSAHLEPWVGAREAPTEATTELQRRLFAAALDVLHRERKWLRGAFLWKWFVEPTRREDFTLDHPAVRDLLKERWAE